jgi:hypothetical protein
MADIKVRQSIKIPRLLIIISAITVVIVAIYSCPTYERSAAKELEPKPEDVNIEY